MSAFDCVIRGGTVATASDVFRADVGIVNGRVAALGLDLAAGTREIDATGKLVLPGGVDSHAHIEQKIGRAVSAGTFATETESAAIGGTTTMICFAAQPKGGSLVEAVNAYQLQARQSRIDYAFHLMITDPRPEILERELPPLIAAGNRSLKIFLANEAARVTDAEALQVMAAARKHGAMVCVHAEHHEMMTFYINALTAAGLTQAEHHAWSRPMLFEREAVHRVLAMAEALDVPIQIFHVTGEESAAEVSRVRLKGQTVWAETCPQYLFFDVDDLARAGPEGAKLICGPAFRTKADQQALWNAIKAGVISNVTSDHAPINFDGPSGKKVAGEDAPFRDIPKGLPGIATRMPLLFSEGVGKSRIDLTTFVAITATNAAKIFGLWPRKGTIAIGSDADIGIWDADKDVTITNDLLRHGCDYTPYEGWQVRGWPETVLLRGEVIAADGKAVGPAGTGAFLTRDLYPSIASRGKFPTPFNPHR